ncbi:ankyrin repeat-containing domain protein [Annulohypoxylon bovei var. microspora]|nr:ankyrin repeat-containing domain protein [Annulohypoxylon bovei var. microspora]
MIMTNDIYGKTPLIFAVEFGHYESVRLLINYGSNIEARDSSGLTPLGLALSYGYIAKTQILLLNGADIEAKDYYGRTPLLLAEKRGSPAITALLLENYSDLEAEEKRDQAKKQIEDLEKRYSEATWPWSNGYIGRSMEWHPRE